MRAVRAGDAGWPAGVSVLAQVAYPLSSGWVRDVLVAAIVLSSTGAAVAHAAARLGSSRAAVALGAVFVLALAVEIAGVHTGLPFGRYAYRHGFGPGVAGVPLLVPCAWVMMAWPSAVVAARLSASRAARVLIGAWAMVAWDLFLDPQMVAAGVWTWRSPGVHLPGMAGVPLSNLAGWLVAGVAVSALLQTVLAGAPRDDAVPVAVYVWTWLGSTVALSVFLHLGAAAGWGAVGMGVVALPAVVHAVPRPARRLAVL